MGATLTCISPNMLTGGTHCSVLWALNPLIHKNCPLSVGNFEYLCMNETFRFHEHVIENLRLLEYQISWMYVNCKGNIGLRMKVLERKFG